jgi:hypothetical protein
MEEVQRAVSSVTGIGDIGERKGKWEGFVEADEKCRGPRKTAELGGVSQRYGIYCATHTPIPSLFSPFLLLMLP